ncbi:sensor histidine kinase [Aureispira anguillae]|uniref:Sensor histidine kinase n=1 Tax=Aureispira anguillae TaxID=2864201 RepID=A0A915YBQ0_9BACT|nr:sensor histidine kinase [Aureispira anguillae]BDS10139.1 sensor histidine kinase [Aureispira anguillae]
MSLLAAQNGLKNTYEFISKRVVYHSLIWFFYILTLLFLDSGEESFIIILRNTLIHVFFLMLIVYTNYLYLIPNYLSKKRFISYLLLLLFTAAIVMPIEMVCLYWNIAGNDNIDAQIELLKKQYGHFILLFLTLIISTILKIIKEWFFQQAVQKDLENKNLQSELSFLKSQINPHFLFNTLNSLYALTLKKSDKAPEIVLRLSEMMRYMLYKSNEKKVPLEQEINYIQNYLALERTRYGDKARIEFECAGDSPANYTIAPLLFITFLENSFKHGLSQSITQGFVECLLYIEDNTIDFTIQNSKTTEKDERYFQGGIGLTNVKRRLELIYPDKYKLDIHETDDIYLVNLKINLS